MFSFPLDHAALDRKRSNTEKMLNISNLERASPEKPVSAFSHCALALVIGLVAGSMLLPSSASAEWWRKNLEQYSYNANNYISTGRIIESRCDLEKGYSSRINFEHALDSKVRSLGYNDSDVRDVAYRVLSFTQDRDGRDFASGVCRIEILFIKDNVDETPRAFGEALSSQSQNELFSPQAGHAPFSQTGAR